METAKYHNAEVAGIPSLKRDAAQQQGDDLRRMRLLLMIVHAAIERYPIIPQPPSKGARGGHLFLAGTIVYWPFLSEVVHKCKQYDLTSRSPL